MLRVHELDKEMSGEDRFHLENISFHLPKGYICGLVGENGAGKTTLLRCLMGLYRSTGDIVIDGHDLNSDEAAARGEIAVVCDEGFFDENINLEKLGKYYGQMYVRFDMEKYLAPYSREQRQQYIQKMFKYRFRVSYIVLLLPILITAIISPDKTLTVSGIVYYMCEMLVMAGILYCTSFDNFLGSVNPGRLTTFDVITFMSAAVVAASYDQNDSSLDLVQILFYLVIGVFFISMIVACRKKYYDDIVRCMADYEFAESKKDKKIA